MPFIAKINRLQGTEKSPYKEHHPHPQNATEKEIDALQGITKTKPTDRTQNKTENTNGEPQKIASEPPNVSPHISERPHKKKKPHRAKKRPERHKEKPPTIRKP